MRQRERERERERKSKKRGERSGEDGQVGRKKGTEPHREMMGEGYRQANRRKHSRWKEKSCVG